MRWSRASINFIDSSAIIRTIYASASARAATITHVPLGHASRAAEAGHGFHRRDIVARDGSVRDVAPPLYFCNSMLRSYVGLWVAQGVVFIAGAAGLHVARTAPRVSHVPRLAAADVPDWQRESCTIMGQITFLVLCVPACYLSDRSLQRGALSRFPAMAAAAALSSAFSFLVLGAARDCSAWQLMVTRDPAFT